MVAADVRASDHGEAALEEIRRLAGPACGPLRYARCDVTSAEDVAALIRLPPRLDVAVVNAGVVEAAPFLDITEDQWARQLDVNLTGAFRTAQAAARRMVEDGVAGRLVFTGSWVADVPWPEITAYATTKAGVHHLARQAARELAVHGVRANVVAPGIVDAGLAARQMRTEPQYVARASRAVPLRRFQTPEDVAGVVRFLCSPAADYLTGSVLLADGGASLHAVE